MWVGLHREEKVRNLSKDAQELTIGVVQAMFAQHAHQPE